MSDSTERHNMHSRASFRDKISRLKLERFLSKNEIAPLEMKRVKKVLSGPFFKIL